MEELVYAKALELAGPLEERQAAMLRLLCSGAVSSLTGRLKNGVSVEDCQEAFVGAASLYALSGLWESGGGVQEFRAGDLTVRQVEGRGAGLRQQADRMLAAFLKDGFSFVGV